MTLANKLLIAFILIAIGLFGLVYFDAFAYTRTPSGSPVLKDEIGYPIYLSHTYDYTRVGCSLWGFILNRASDNYTIYSSAFNYYDDIYATFYSLSDGVWTVGLYQTGVYIGGSIPCNAPNNVNYWSDTFTISPPVAITYPIDNETYLSEPDHFSISYSLDSSYYSASYQYKYFMIRYGSSPDLLTFENNRQITTLATSGVIDFIPKTTALNGVGYAKPTLLFCDSPNGTCDRAIQGALITWNAPTLASVTSGTPNDFGVIGNAFRDVLLWVFVPSDNAFNQFTTLLTPIENKPPIGYFTLISASFSSLASGSATVSLDLTAIEPITTPFKTGLAWLLWVLWAVWALGRVTKFNWHL